MSHNWLVIFEFLCIDLSLTSQDGPIFLFSSNLNLERLRQTLRVFFGENVYWMNRFVLEVLEVLVNISITL